jgi:D-3-phosphoglycerate dehydrogenase
MPKGIVWVITPFVLNYDDPDALFRPLAEATGLEIRIDDARPLFTEEEMIKELPGVVATIAGSEPYTRRVFENAHDLKIVSRSGVGLNSIDLPAATASGVVVTNAVGQNAVSVAEHTMAILLAAARRVPWMEERFRKGAWREIQVPMAPLMGKTIGILGFGNIGKRVAKRAAAFDMKIIACDPIKDEESAREVGAVFLPIEDVAREADFLCCHVPLSPKTKDLIGKNLLALMKPGAFVINTSRGGLVNLDAIADALERGAIRGAALDVFPSEPPDYEHPIFSMENVVLTPHAAGRGEDAVYNTVRHAMNCITEYLAGRRPPDVANPEVFKSSN